MGRRCGWCGLAVLVGLCMEASVSAPEPEDDGGFGLSINGSGIIGTALGIVILWALCFGVTIGGKHYGLAGCDSDKGVQIDGLGGE